MVTKKKIVLNLFSWFIDKPIIVIWLLFLYGKMKQSFLLWKY